MIIIFDLDGTLFDTSTTIVPAVMQTLQEFNLPQISEEEICYGIGQPSAQFYSSISTNQAPEDISGLRERIRYYERKYLSEQGQLYSGVKELLMNLKTSDNKLVICSTGSVEYINLVIELMGVKEYFDLIKSSQGNNTKGNLIREVLTEFAADFAIVIGDRDTDFLAAQENGLPFIGAKYGFGQAELSETHFLASDPREVGYYVHWLKIFTQLQSWLEEFLLQNKIPIIGINGVDTSGKTSSAVLLENYLQKQGFKVIVIHLDDFHNPSEVRNSGSEPIQSYIDNAFNLEMICQEILNPISEGKIIDKELTLLDLDSNSFTLKKRFSIDEDTVVILEGVLLYREPLDHFFNYRIFLDISFAEVLNRAKIRDVPKYGQEFIQRYRQKYIPIQQKYLDLWRPMDRADLIINNTDFFYPKTVFKEKKSKKLSK